MSVPPITFVSKVDGKKHVLNIEYIIKTSNESCVALLKDPPNTVMKTIVEAENDYEGAVTLYFLKKDTLCSPNFPKLRLWAGAEHVSYWDARIGKEKYYVYLMERGNKIESVFVLAKNQEQHRHILFQMANPLVAMHRKGWLHGDVKPDNYLTADPLARDSWEESSVVEVDSTKYRTSHLCEGLHIWPLLIDFGLTRLLQDQELKEHMVVTADFRPPELVFVKPGQKIIYDELAEAFCFGMTIFYLLATKYSVIVDEVPEDFICDVMSCLGRKMATSEILNFVYDSELPKVARGAWNLVQTIGYPGDEVIRQTPLGMVIYAHKDTLLNSKNYRWPYNTSGKNLVRGTLGDEGVDLIQDLTAWERADRITLADAIHHHYFENLRDDTAEVTHKIANKL